MAHILFLCAAAFPLFIGRGLFAQIKRKHGEKA
jgi:hypothetical protein